MSCTATLRVATLSAPPTDNQFRKRIHGRRRAKLFAIELIFKIDDWLVAKVFRFFFIRGEPLTEEYQCVC